MNNVKKTATVKRDGCVVVNSAYSLVHVNLMKNARPASDASKVIARPSQDVEGTRIVRMTRSAYAVVVHLLRNVRAQLTALKVKIASQVDVYPVYVEGL